MKTVIRSFLSVFLVACFGAPAFAAPGLTISDLHMRAGRSVNTPVITTVPGGNTVEVYDCRGAWCAASWGRFHGYMNRKYLDVSRGPAPVYSYAPPPPVVYGPPAVYRPGPFYYGPRYYGWRSHYWYW
jgi:uncharacterized protein YraI